MDKMLESDHDAVLDDLAGIITGLRADGYAPIGELAVRGTLESVKELRRQLGRHMDMEERLLFPMLEELVAGAVKKLAPLTADHRQILALADRLEAAPTRESARVLMAALLLHIDNEDTILDELLKGLPASYRNEVARRALEWRIERWLEDTKVWLEMAGLEVHVRGFDGETLRLILRSPLTEPESIAELEQRIGEMVKRHEPRLTKIEIHHDTLGGVRHAKTP